MLRKAFGESLVPFRVSHYPIDKRGFVSQGYFFDLRGLAEVLSHVNGPLLAWLGAHRPSRPLLPEEVAGSTALWEGAVSHTDHGECLRAERGGPEAVHRALRGQMRRLRREVYGEVAEGQIHVHHLKPISEVGEGYEVDPVEDLWPVCPNCHAVIHLRSDPPYLIEDVKSFLSRVAGGRRTGRPGLS